MYHKGNENDRKRELREKVKEGALDFSQQLKVLSDRFDALPDDQKLEAAEKAGYTRSVEKENKENKENKLNFYKVFFGKKPEEVREILNKVFGENASKTIAARLNKSRDRTKGK